MITPLRMISRCFHVPSVFPARSSLPKESGYIPGYRSQGCPSHPWGPEAVTNKVHTRTHSASSLFSGPVPAESSASPLLPPQPSSEGLWPHSHTRRRVPGWCSCMAGWSLIFTSFSAVFFCLSASFLLHLSSSLLFFSLLPASVSFLTLFSFVLLVSPPEFSAFPIFYF